LNFAAKQVDVYSTRHEDTGTWLLEHEKYQEWTKGQSRILFCPGMPGAGKTVLTSIVIENLRPLLADPDTGLAFVYFDYKDGANHTISNVFSSLLQQLLKQMREIPPKIDQLYCRCEDEKRRPSLAELLDAIEDLGAGFDRIMFAADALDECQTDTRERFLRELRKLSFKPQLFCTSRFSKDTEELLGEIDPKIEQIEIRASRADIEQYIRGVVSEKRELSKFCKTDSNLELQIVSNVANSASGM
jgi:hypothetical protein